MGTVCPMRCNFPLETMDIESNSQTRLRYNAVLTLSIPTYRSNHRTIPYNTVHYFTTYLTKQINQTMLTESEILVDVRVRVPGEST
jgi:hypothetical protein